MNKNKNIFHNQKHLTLSDRTYMEQELVQGSSFKSIADVLQKDPSTIAKEIKRTRIITPAEPSYKCRGCMNYSTCEKKHICGDWYNLLCRGCYRKNPTHISKNYISWNCDQLNKPPYACNHCDKYKWCRFQKAFQRQFKVSPDEVMLKPVLLENRVKEREGRYE